MSAKPVNLRQFRKRKAREDKARTAEANRIAHGRTKTEKQISEAEKAKAAAQIEAHKRDRGED